MADVACTVSDDLPTTVVGTVYLRVLQCAENRPPFPEAERHISSSVAENIAHIHAQWVNGALHAEDDSLDDSDYDPDAADDVSSEESDDGDEAEGEGEGEAKAGDESEHASREHEEEDDEDEAVSDYGDEMQEAARLAYCHLLRDYLEPCPASRKSSDVMQAWNDEEDWTSLFHTRALRNHRIHLRVEALGHNFFRMTLLALTTKTITRLQRQLARRVRAWTAAQQWGECNMVDLWAEGEGSGLAGEDGTEEAETVVLLAGSLEELLLPTDDAGALELIVA